jgi:hypothetical protein
MRSGAHLICSVRLTLGLQRRPLAAEIEAPARRETAFESGRSGAAQANIGEAALSYVNPLTSSPRRSSVVAETSLAQLQARDNLGKLNRGF